MNTSTWRRRALGCACALVILLLWLVNLAGASTALIPNAFAQDGQEGTQNLQDAAEKEYFQLLEDWNRKRADVFSPQKEWPDPVGINEMSEAEVLNAIRSGIEELKQSIDVVSADNLAWETAVAQRRNYVARADAYRKSEFARLNGGIEAELRLILKRYRNFKPRKSDGE